MQHIRALTDGNVIAGNRRLPEITGEDNLTVFSYSGRVKSPEWRWQRRRADLRHFEIFRHGPIIICTRLPPGGTCYPICTFPASSECLIGLSDAFSPFVYGYPSSSPRAHCTPNKSVPTLRYTRRHGPRYTGPCPKALTECSPLDFRRSSISEVHKLLGTGGVPTDLLNVVVLAVADGLFGLDGSERWDELLIATRSHPPPFPRP